MSAEAVGKLYFSSSGWLLLSVPNAVVRGHFDSLDEPGIELPIGDSTRLEAHISVMRPEELQSIGGPRAVTERGRDFHYIVGRMKTVTPSGWPDVSRAWVLPVKSRELEQLRKTYGLPALPQHPFHITVAIRRKGVLYENARGKGNGTISLQDSGRDRAGRKRDRGEDREHRRGVAYEYTGPVTAGEPTPANDRYAKVAGEMVCCSQAPVESAEVSLATDDPHRFDNDWFALLGRIKTAVAIPGIPNIRDVGDLSKIQAGQLLDFVIQRHAARRAGEHYDVRFGDPTMGAFSWATRKELPSAGKRIALFRQPLHHHGYMPFQGTLRGGYGAGTVRTHQKGKILVTRVSPNRISFTLAGQRYPERFALIRPRSFADKAWLLVNTTPVEATPYNKVHYNRIPQEQVANVLKGLAPGTSVQAKIDGAAALVKLLENGVEVMSYRVAKETGRPLIHTERVFGGRPTIKIPKELVGTVLKGELYGSRTKDESGRAAPTTAPPGSQAGAAGDDGRALEGHEAKDTETRTIPPQELGGILNSTIANALRAQKEKRIKLKTMLYDIQQLGQKAVAAETPYAERLAMLRKVLAHLPADVFHLPDAAGPEDAQALWEQITRGEHPLTEEGIVIHPPTGTPSKAKLLEEHDVHIRDIFPGEGKYEGAGAGGFTYSMEPGGPILGRVGTGLSDELRREMLEEPEAFIGRVAKVRSQGPFPSGALRAPALYALHEDYPVKTAAKRTTIAVDLDGTLAKHYDKYDADSIPDPRPGAKDAMEAFKAKGCKVIIYTVRGNKKLIKDWLKEHEIPYDYINENPDQPSDTSDKPIADLYIDDRGVDARASWTKILERTRRRLKLRAAPSHVPPEDRPAKAAKYDENMICGECGRKTSWAPHVDDEYLHPHCMCCGWSDMSRNGRVKKATDASLRKVAADIFGDYFEKQGLSLPQIIAREARKVEEPTEAQAEAGNYRKGHFRMHGMDFTIENAKGSVRSGTDKAGKKWSIKMKNPYGYIRRTEDKDGDHVDVFLGPNPNTELVFVVDQVDPATKRFDEHKTLFGFDTKEEARQAYLDNYEKEWKGLGDITALTLDQFKAWLSEGSQTRPLASQVFQVKRAGDDPESHRRPPILIIRRHTSISMVTPKLRADESDESPELAKQLRLRAEQLGRCIGTDPDKVLEKLQAGLHNTKHKPFF